MIFNKIMKLIREKLISYEKTNQIITIFQSRKHDDNWIMYSIDMIVPVMKLSNFYICICPMTKNEIFRLSKVIN